MDIISYILSKKYTDNTVDGLGAIKGAPCTVQSIVDITDGKRVTLAWESNSGVEQTQSFDIMNGEDGDTIEWNQIQHSGTKIAEININGVSTDVYAPTGGGGSGDVVDVKVNGESVVNSENIAEIDIPTGEVKTATDTFTTVNGGLLEECVIDLVPVQDLHGYSEPWVGGAGKNKADISADTESDSQRCTLTYGDNNAVTITATDNYARVGFSIPVESGREVTLSFYASINASMYAQTRVNNSVSWGNPTYGNIQGVTTTRKRYTLTFTTTSTTLFIGFYATSTQSSGDMFIDSVMVEYGSSASDFAPYSNICPINGHTEVDLYNVAKNLLNPNKFLQGKPSDPSDTTRVSTRGDKTIVANLGDTFTASCSNNNYMFAVYVQNESNVTVYDSGWQTGNFTKTIESGQEGYLRMSFRNAASTDITVSEIQSLQTQIEKGNQATAYEPYLGHLYQVQIGSTVYGGYVDLVSGVMNAEFAKCKVSDLDWSVPSTTQTTNVYRMRSQSLRSVILKPSASTDLTDILSDSYGTKTGRQTWECIQGIALDSAGDVIIYDDNYNTSTSYTDFASDMGNVEIIYPLATPITIQLTPQQIEALPKVNNLSTPLDGQSIDSVKYREVFAFDDVEKVVSLRVPISMLGTDESGRTTASKSYASGDYFYKDGYMCKALTSISAGATLTLNTNYSQGTLADILKAIENA